MSEPDLLGRWNEPGRLSITTTPPVLVTLERYQTDPITLRHSIEAPRDLGSTPLTDLQLPQGSYRLRLDGTAPVYLPLVIHRGEALALDLTLPRPADIPEGFVYIPEGRFQFGSDDEETLRKFFVAVPQHDVTTTSYLIARNETTFAEWIEFLETLSPAERKSRLASTENLFAGVGLTRSDDGVWTLSISMGETVVQARQGQPIVYPGRQKNASQDWLRMPAVGLNFSDAEAYIAWLARTGKVPGARLCNEHEWERAARGADGRNYPGGEHLEPDDAAFDRTYGRAPGTQGPDEVGLHPASHSPHGLADTVGNAWEWVRSSLVADEVLIRGGSHAFDDTSARSMNRGLLGRDIREPTTGLRVCATPRSDDGS